MHYIATATSTGSSDLRFSNIPQTFQHLQIRYFLRSTNSPATTDFSFMRFNSDFTAGNYASHWVAGDGATAFSDKQTGTNYAFGTIIPGGGAATNLYGAGIVDIYDYSNTSKNKTFKIIGGFDSNGTGSARLVSGLWLSTSGITDIYCTSPNNYSAAGSIATLYGFTSNPIATGE